MFGIILILNTYARGLLETRACAGSPARSIASLELHEVGKKIEGASHKLTAYLERIGVKAVAPAAAFPMEMDQRPGKIFVVSHKPVAVAAGLGQMGLHRNVIHPVFGRNLNPICYRREPRESDN